MRKLIFSPTLLSVTCKLPSTAMPMASSPGYPGMERWKGKVALVTGASAGIGYTTAKQLTELGMNVVGCARNISTIEVNTYTSLPSRYKVYNHLVSGYPNVYYCVASSLQCELSPISTNDEN